MLDSKEKEDLFPKTISALTDGSKFEYLSHPTVNFKPLFVSGFGYSGSSAVADFLKDTLPQEVQNFANWEFRLLWSIGKGKSLGDWLINADDDECSRGTLKNLVSYSFLGINEGLVPEKYNNKIHTYSVINFFNKRDFAKLDEIFSGFICEVMENIGNKELVRAACKKLFFHLIALRYNGSSSYMLMDNGVLARDPSVLSYIEDYCCIAVVRNPMDIFSERRKLGNWKKGVDAFVAEYERYYDSFLSFSKNTDEEKLLVVDFESFLRTSETRNEVLAFLGSNVSAGEGKGQYFDASKSLLNVDIWSKDLSAEEVQEFKKHYASSHFLSFYFESDASL